MKTLPLSTVKAQLSKLIDAVEGRDEQVTITRNGRPVAMLVSPSEIESWKATMEILSDPEWVADIRRGVRNLDEGKVLSEREIEQIFGLKPGEAAPVIGPGVKRRMRPITRRPRGRA
ncbi:MAG: type II toxin-antitoxin system Phd/YefM family antitoxin [Chloroflexi bacterium]|nr:type II toxin-antitoxin system Phd/YefM family antitoxin [Chloroflexota bacterium]